MPCVCGVGVGVGVGVGARARVRARSGHLGISGTVPQECMRPSTHYCIQECRVPENTIGG